jgi:hypothetical protein
MSEAGADGRDMPFEAYDERLILWLAPALVRDRLRVILALDVRLRHIPQTVREPLLGDIKLAWWREQLIALDAAAVPAEPLLQAVSAILDERITGALLAGLVDEDTRVGMLTQAITTLCGAHSKSLRLFQMFTAHDANRRAQNRPLASPALRTFMAIQMRLLGR